MTVLFYVFIGLLGLIVGSFLNVCIDRLPNNKSIVSPPSSCDACGHRLAIIDLIPLFSYVFLKGKCRYCGARIPLRIPLVELATALIFIFLFWQYGITYQLALMAVYAAVLLTISVIDLQTNLILNVIVYPMAILVFVVDIFLPGVGWWRALAGMGIGFGILLIPALISRAGMGAGDVKLAGLIGLMVVYPRSPADPTYMWIIRVFAAILVGIIIGGIVAIILIIARKKTRKDVIAFGPYLALGAFIILVWGKQLIDGYLHLFGL